MKHVCKFKVAVLMVILLLFCTACGNNEQRERIELSYEICPDNALPDVLLEIIEDKKLHEFTFSYTDGASTYIVVGYGERNRTNYRVVLEDIYATDSAIYIETNLYTKENENADYATGTPSMYPYIVIKVNKLSLPVIYDTKRNITKIITIV